MSLHNAVKQLAFEVCFSLIESGADVNAVDDDNKTPLHHAVGSDESRNTAKEDNTRQQITELLLGKGANVDAKTDYGRTSLHLAAMRGSQRLVEILLEHGAAVDLASDIGATALTIAIDRGYAKVVGTLVSRGADVSGVTPLYRAMMMSQGLTEITNILLRHGADVNQVVNGKTALHMASSQGHVNVIKALLNAGASVNVTDEAGETPWEILGGLENPGDFLDAFAVLLELGAERDFIPTNGQPLLHKLVSKWISREEKGFGPLMQLFFNAGVCCNATDTGAQTLLHLCAGSYDWYVEEIQLLLSNDADIDAENSAGETALHLATRKGLRSNIEVLLDHGADPSVTNIRGETVLDVLEAYKFSPPYLDLGPDFLKEVRRKMREACLDFSSPREQSPLALECSISHPSIFDVRNMRRHILHDDFTLYCFMKKRPTVIADFLIIEALKQVDIYDYPYYKWALKNRIKKFARRVNIHMDFSWNSILRGVPPLFRAIATDQDKWELSRLLRLRGSGKEFSADIGSCETALHQAIEKAEVETMHLLIKHGASVNAVDDSGRTSLVVLIEKVGGKTASRLWPTNEAWALFPPTALIDSIRSVSYFSEMFRNALQELLAAGADANTTDNEGNTLLHVLAAFIETGDELDMVIDELDMFLIDEPDFKENEDLLASMQMLLDSGAKIYERNDAGETALHLACASQSALRIKLLLDNGADISLQNGQGQTTLDKVRSDPSCHAFYAFEDDDPVWLDRWNSDGDRSFRSKSSGDQKAMVLLEHLTMLMAVGLLPRRVIKYRDDEAPTWWTSTSSVIGSPFGPSIDREVKRMKNLRLCCHRTLFDMLFKENESSYYEFPSLRQALDSLNFQDFTHYGSILKNFAKKYKRKYIIEGSEKYLSVLIKTSNALNFNQLPVLNAETVRLIFAHLNFSDRAALVTCVDQLRNQVFPRSS